jgi:hypothetical protein
MIGVFNITDCSHKKKLQCKIVDCDMQGCFKRQNVQETGTLVAYPVLHGLPRRITLVSQMHPPAQFHPLYQR